MRSTFVLWTTAVVVASAAAQATGPINSPRIALPTGHAPVPVVAPPPAQEPVVAGPENLQTFDPRSVRLAWVNRRWQLVHNGQVLKDFGPRQQDARLALRLIHEYGLNQHGQIGSPQPVMEYWLSDGKPPRGLISAGLRSMPLEPARLSVEQANGQWCLRDGQQVLFAFGPRAEEARQALGVIRKYGFNQVGVLGQGAPSMYVFLNRPGESQAAPLAGPGSIAPARFSRVAKNADGSPRVEMPAKTAEHPLAGVVSPVLPALPATAPLIGQRTDSAWRSQPVTAGAPMSAPQESIERVPFDWRQVQLKQDQGSWKLVTGSLVLADFGPHVQDARLALAAMRHYRFTEQYRVSEAPSLNYFLPSGQSPRGLMMGLHSTMLEHKHLAVQKVGEDYALCQGKRVVLRMGPRQQVANKFLDTIKVNSVDRLCQIGEPGKPGVTILVRSR